MLKGHWEIGQRDSEMVDNKEIVFFKCKRKVAHMNIQ